MSDPAAMPPAQKLDNSGASLSRNFSRQDSVDAPACGCAGGHGPEKRYYHVGLRMRVQQYNINGRKMALSLPVAPLDSLKKGMDDFHNLTDSAFEASRQTDDPRMPKKLYPIGTDTEAPELYEADMICATELVAETGLEGYQKGGTQGDLNEFLGTDLGMHLSRTRTFRVKTSGDYEHDQLARVEPLAQTEKMCCRVFTYLKAKIDGNDTYYEIKNGAISGTLGYDDYRKRALIQDNVYNDKEGGAMPFIPGVYQLHVLMESSSEGSFALKEIHCDGDCIYPE